MKKGLPVLDVQTLALAEQHRALEAYLQGLLSEVALESPAELQTPAPSPELRVVGPPAAEQDPSATVLADAQTGVAEPPVWGRTAFPCLMFEVGKLCLAAPLEKLNGVQSWSDDITPMVGQPDWFLGLLRLRGRNIQVVDTGPLIAPRSRQASLLDQAPSATRSIILFDEGCWGLACDRVASVVTLEPSQVRWRPGGAKRPWFAGMLIEQMAALVDVEAFAAMLERGGT